MTDVSNRSRVQAGVPQGGEFAREARGENGDLVAERNWGAVQVPSRYLGVPVDVIDEVAPGIVYAGTPSHGCYKLSEERNLEIPVALRKRSGVYDEDDGACIVQAFHPAAFADTSDEAAKLRADGMQAVKDHYPDAYTRATGEVLTTADSYALRQRADQAARDAFKAEHASEFVTENHSISAPALCPEGYKLRVASKAATGEERIFLERDNRASTWEPHDEAPVRVIDRAKAVDITDLVAEREAFYRPVHPVLTGGAVAVDPSWANSGARDRAQIEKDLHTPYRFREDDGTITNETMLQRFARKGIIGKRVAERSNRSSTQYDVEMPDGRFQTISKAAWESLRVPDLTTDSDRDTNLVVAAQRRVDKAEKAYRDTSNWDAKKKARADLDAARTAYEDVSRQAENRRLVRYGEFQGLEGQLGAEALRRTQEFSALD